MVSTISAKKTFLSLSVKGFFVTENIFLTQQTGKKKENYTTYVIELSNFHFFSYIIIIIIIIIIQNQLI